ncbi:uncharacterized protein BT62DRAFT_932633 [Guyanagaster necrorhizus]|uniref:Nucleolar protein 12 n=1 Tax=Guyanagaster necrorhizus TaxID=856835 RepID=A0A9P8ART4_9AGAR|nr:uncharacterized protein BT62DRAFT_932633 [Guyanagaster necrorhizus MCA 3950]KAG7445534.1 hypothetical protein BT62DRAFT_932633 [Guyanagaster necrorhizus MCA 3950]
MTLGSLLLPSSSKSIDRELDSLFQSNATKPSLISGPSKSNVTEVTSKRRKNEQESAISTKRFKATSSESVKQGKTSKPIKKQKTLKHTTKIDTDGENDGELEDAYAKLKEAQIEKDGESESDEDPSKLVHESVAQSGPSAGHSSQKRKFVPSDETQMQRDLRTIFVGNLSIEVAQKKSALKQLHRHIIGLISNAKIESTRFRSVAFQTPTSKLPEDDTSEKKVKVPGKTKQGREHDKNRASSWRDNEEDSTKNDEKKFLTPSQKKRIAFINHDFHSSADLTNAYIVFAHPVPSENRPSNLPPLPSTLDPYEAARLAADLCNGSTFMDRVLRVDLVGRMDTHSHGDPFDGDPKSSIFVGNLDFGSKEDDLRVFFETLVTGERGLPAGNDEQDGDAKKTSTWVTRVRIVRDKETQLGKGFAYVQFADRQCVDEVLALEEAKLKFAKRTLRVQRCKTLPGKRQTTSSVSTGTKTSVQPSIPAGDPSLGDRLAHLTKEARKHVKSTDADRVARRLAKKKARLSLGKEGVKMHGKERERSRKKPSSGSSRKTSSSKSARVRSDKSIAKKNMKKQ